MTGSPFALTMVGCSRLRPRSRLFDKLATLGLDRGPRRLRNPQIRAKGDSEVDRRRCYSREKVFTMCPARSVYYVPVHSRTRANTRITEAVADA